MWFAARGHYTHNHWLLNLAYRLLTQQNEGLALPRVVFSTDYIRCDLLFIDAYSFNLFSRPVALMLQYCVRLLPSSVVCNVMYCG